MAQEAPHSPSFWQNARPLKTHPHDPPPFAPLAVPPRPFAEMTSKIGASPSCLHDTPRNTHREEE